jgi:acid phosphatase
MMENQPYGAIVGSSAAPFINDLIARHGLATGYHAVAHPSQPNYIALFSGSTQGVADDLVHQLDAPNLADQLEAQGRTWAVFAQNVPTACYTGDSASGGPDGPGTYARKHEPAISFTSIASDPARCARISDLSHFDPAAADFELIVPNMCNDMHDCSVARGDAFLASFVPRITSSPAFADSVLFITWDEGGGDQGGGGRVPLVIVSPLVRPGTASSVAHDHYSLLRTIEDAWGLGCLARSCAANDLRELFTR